MHKSNYRFFPEVIRKGTIFLTEKEVLIDICGVHEVNWREKHRKSLEYAEMCRKLSNANRGRNEEKADGYYKRYEKVKECGTCLLFGKRKDASDLEKKLMFANFCKERFCPTCMWRRSMKYSYQLQKVFNHSMVAHPDSEFIFLTLTEKNVKAENLKNAIKGINSAYSRLFHYKRLVDNVIIGTVRATECTFNQKRRDFNLHVHVLIQVELEYFDLNKNYYLDQKEWQKLWRKAAKLDYDPVIDIRSVHKNETSGKDSLSAAVSEIAKYEVKSYEFIDIKKPKLSMWLLDIYMTAFKGARNLGLSGELRQIKLELFSKNNNDDELIHMSDSESELQGDIVFLQYHWDSNLGDYCKTDVSDCLIDYVMSRRRRRYA